MTEILTTFIPCIPPKTTAQQKGAYAMPGGNGVRFFKKKGVKQAEAIYTELLRPHVPPEPLSGPVRVQVGFVFPWRKSEPKKNRTTGIKWHDKRPDVDNLAKNVLDVMSALGYWLDDSQIADVRITKEWGDRPGLKIGIDTL